MIAIVMEGASYGVQEIETPEGAIRMLVLTDPTSQISVRAPLSKTEAEKMAAMLRGSGLVVPGAPPPPGPPQGGGEGNHN